MLPNVGQRRSAREKAAVNYGVDTANSSDDVDLMEDDDDEKEEDHEVGCRFFAKKLFLPRPPCVSFLASSRTK